MLWKGVSRQLDTAEEAVDAIVGIRPDLVLTDLASCESRGSRWRGAVINRDPGARNVILSASPVWEYIAAAVRVGLPGLEATINQEPASVACQSPLSAPRTKRSMLPEPRDAAEGSEDQLPPSEVQAPLVPP